MSKFLVLAIIVAMIAFYLMRSNANKEAAKVNVATGNEFLQTNKNSEGIIETSSGLQYKVLTVGEGTEHPSAFSKVKVHYHGSLLDGTVFDSSVDRGEPISFDIE